MINWGFAYFSLSGTYGVISAFAWVIGERSWPQARAYSSQELLAAGAWLGGLVALFSLVARAVRTSSPDWDAEARNAAIRFSGMGYLAVATLIVSGLINSWFLIGSPSNLGTPYGQLLIVKLVLFGGMLGLAGVNRFLIVPKFFEAKVGHHSGALPSLRRHIVGEQALGLAIILIVSVLGTMRPAVTP